MKHPGLKIASILCAATLWLYVVSGHMYQVETRLPIRYTNLSPKLALVHPLPDSITVILEGEGKELIRLQEHLGYLDCRLHEMQLGENQIALQTTDYHPPFSESGTANSIKLIQFQERNLFTAEFDTRLHKMVRIHNKIGPEAAKGYVLVGTPALEPTELRVHGARKNLTKVFAIPTQEEKLPKLTRDTSIQVQIQSSGPLLDIPDSTVKLHVKVQPLESRVFTQVPLQLTGVYDKSRYRLQPSRFQLTVNGGSEVMDSLDLTQIRAFIDFTRFAIEGQEELKPTVSIPLPVQSYRLEPELFRLDSSQTAIFVDSLAKQKDQKE